MRLEDDALHDRLKSLLDSNSRVRTDFAAKRLLMDRGELIDRINGMKTQYKLIVDGNRIVDSIKAYKQSWIKARVEIPTSELSVLDDLREQMGTHFIEDGVVSGYHINGGHVIALRLSMLGLETLPSHLEDLSMLRELRLNDNNLRSIPKVVLNLPNLEHLDVSNNQITSLPDSIKCLDQMHNLDVGNNQLTTLPKMITRLTHLDRLSVPCNAISPLPDIVGNLAALKCLDVNNNKLTALPESIGNLTALEELHASGNYLSRLPASIEKLHALTVFDLENNFINMLPACIEKLQCGCLKQLKLAGNPMRGNGENRDPWDCL